MKYYYNINKNELKNNVASSHVDIRFAEDNMFCSHIGVYGGKLQLESDSHQSYWSRHNFVGLTTQIIV